MNSESDAKICGLYQGITYYAMSIVVILIILIYIYLKFWKNKDVKLYLTYSGIFIGISFIFTVLYFYFGYGNVYLGYSDMKDELYKDGKTKYEAVSIIQTMDQQQPNQKDYSLSDMSALMLMSKPQQKTETQSDKSV